MSLLEQVRALPPYQWAAGVKRRLVQAQRERVARLIFQLPPRPVPAPASDRVSIHVLTSRRDWLGALWSVRTFLDFSRESLPVVFHDDGGLTAEMGAKLRAFLPGAEVVSAATAAATVEKHLKNFPRCREARQKHPTMMKLFDIPLLAAGERFLLLDSDLLFFSAPREISQWLADAPSVNLWNEDEINALNLTAEEARQRHGVALTERLNSGCGSLWRKSMDLQLLEDYFSHESIWRHPHRVEQTAYALLSSRFGVRLLPKTYLVDTNRAIGVPPGVVMKHYVGKIRDLFYSEGIGHLVAQGYLAGAH